MLSASRTRLVQGELILGGALGTSKAVLTWPIGGGVQGRIDS
jgi:hypothetical protein